MADIVISSRQRSTHFIMIICLYSRLLSAIVVEVTVMYPVIWAGNYFNKSKCNVRCIIKTKYHGDYNRPLFNLMIPPINQVYKHFALYTITNIDKHTIWNICSARHLGSIPMFSVVKSKQPKVVHECNVCILLCVGKCKYFFNTIYDTGFV